MIIEKSKKLNTVIPSKNSMLLYFFVVNIGNSKLKIKLIVLNEIFISLILKT